MAAKYELLKNLTSATAETRTFLVRVVNPEVIDYVCWLRRGGLRVFFLVALACGLCGGIGKLYVYVERVATKWY